MNAMNDWNAVTGVNGVTAVRRLEAVFSSRRIRACVNAAAGVAILAGVVAVAGGEPFLRGLTSVTPSAIVAAAMLTAIATWAAAWRWRLISAGLGLPLGQPRAVAAYYRSQFLNTVLPGGVVGDVHRALTHGMAEGRPADASRAVVSERTAGQAVQLALAAVVLTGLGYRRIRVLWVPCSSRWSSAVSPLRSSPC